MSLNVWCRINISVLVGNGGFIIHQIAKLTSVDKGKGLGLALQTFYRMTMMWFDLFDTFTFWVSQLNSRNADIMVSSTISCFYLKHWEEN